MNLNMFQSSIGNTSLTRDGRLLTLKAYIQLTYTPTQPLEAVNRQYVDTMFANLDARNVVGQLIPTRFPAFTGTDVGIPASSGTVTLTNTGIIAGLITKPNVDVKGRVIGGGIILSTDISDIGFEKITVNKPTTLAGYGITDGVSNVNGNVTGHVTIITTPTQPTDSANKQYIDSYIGLGGLDIGDIVRKACLSTPPDFFKCNGAVLNKTTYANLYNVIGDKFGVTYSPGAGRPWEQQYLINTIQTGDILNWTSDTNTLPITNANAVYIVTKNRVYMIGGTNGNGRAISAINTVYSAPINVDGTVGIWVTEAPLPVTGLGFSSGLVIKNRIYLFGGWTLNGPTINVYANTINQDGTIGTVWSIISTLPGALSHTSAILTKNRIYLLGGVTTGSVYVSTVYTTTINLDGSLATWTTDSNSLITPFAAAKTIMTRNRVYLLGGNTTGSVSSANIYTAPINADGTLGAWAGAGYLPIGTASFGIFVTKNTAYIIGNAVNGVSQSTVLTSTINADGTLSSWNILTLLPGVTSSNDIICTNNRIYSFGGLIGFTTLNVVYTTTINGGLSDYSQYYNGTIIPFTNGTDFALPDYSVSDKALSDNVYSYIKYQ